ncbi:MAG: hypothetical protein Q4D06_09270 [Coriobacteriia bacterium]|nr:hypothetical protein [Coriobacteriia bacterium]
MNAMTKQTGAEPYCPSQEGPSAALARIALGDPPQVVHLDETFLAMLGVPNFAIELVPDEMLSQAKDLLTAEITPALSRALPLLPNDLSWHQASNLSLRRLDGKPLFVCIWLCRTEDGDVLVRAFETGSSVLAVPQTAALIDDICAFTKTQCALELHFDTAKGSITCTRNEHPALFDIPVGLPLAAEPIESATLYWTVSRESA